MEATHCCRRGPKGLIRRRAVADGLSHILLSDEERAPQIAAQACRSLQLPSGQLFLSAVATEGENERTASWLAAEAAGPQLPLARAVCQRSTERWGEDQATVIVGRHPTLTIALEQTARFARSESPVLITGETGTGKELFARALYLLSSRSKGTFAAVNCAQYLEGQIMASELFGHKRGSFTGAVADHRGIFEAAEGGVVFLDEVGELSSQAQAMLLRLLSEGEILPVGETRARRVNVRTVMATNRNLKEMVEAGRFRADLYYRCRYLQLHIPPVRDRGGDWELILGHYLARLADGRQRKTFSSDSLALLSTHHWPGNVREIRGVVDTGFHLSDGVVIEPADFGASLEEVSRAAQIAAVPLTLPPESLFSRLISGEGTFWDLVHHPYLERDLNRAQVRGIMAQGLRHSGGSYKRLLESFGVAQEDYLRFMDFLRHHRLKPNESAPPLAPTRTEPADGSR
jgi:transcriptional regulator with GAF, ATPase, and Fis domain